MFNRRRVIQQRKQTKPPPKSSLCTSLKILIIIFIIILCLISLYLSTHLLQQRTNAINLNNDTIQNMQPDIQNINNKKDIIKDQKLLTALQKSLNMYLTRPGHIDRVEYMIGFKGQRIPDTEYSNLLPRDNNKKYDRNYIQSPVSISGWHPQPDSEHKCDANCISSCNNNCDVNGIKWSMENVEISESNNILTGSTKLSSLIPVPYFSYWDFGFMTPMNTQKRKESLAAAFISNCGFPKRNKMVRDLQTHGVKVDSYGRCEHNKDEQRDHNQGREQKKVELLSTYKFSLAFENSETDDYVSEKYFGSLTSGSVPVYIGAPNIKFFAPDAGNMDIGGPGKPWKSHAVIWAGDFDFDAKRLAEYLLYLDGNDTAYNEYIQWKLDGFSGDFKALVELTSATHTNCRQCILGTDWQRYKHGVTEYDEAVGVFDYGMDGNKWVYVRERGMYRFVLIRIEENTLKGLVENILQSIEPKPVNKWKNNDHPNYDRIGPALYAIYNVPTKHVVNSDEAIQNIQDYVELEVIFV